MFVKVDFFNLVTNVCYAFTKESCNVELTSILCILFSFLRFRQVYLESNLAQVLQILSKHSVNSVTRWSSWLIYPVIDKTLVNRERILIWFICHYFQTYCFSKLVRFLSNVFWSVCFSGSEKWKITNADGCSPVDSRKVHHDVVDGQLRLRFFVFSTFNRRIRLLVRIYIEKKNKLKWKNI